MLAHLTPDARGGRRDFTCVLPVYGGDDPIDFTAAMESVATATVPPAEVLICEDGPLPPDLADAVSACERRWSVRRVRNPGPPGLEHSLNHGIQFVRTPWIARADADDLNLPGRFLAQVTFLDQHRHIAALGGEIVEFWPDGRRRRKPMPRSHEAIVRFARWRNPINHMTAFFSTEVFRACGGYPLIAFKQDYGLWLRMIAAGAVLANLEEVLVHARLGATFYRRRAGLRNIASERDLYLLKRRIPEIGGAASLMAFVTRALALSGSSSAAVVYEAFLRR